MQVQEVDVDADEDVARPADLGWMKAVLRYPRISPAALLCAMHAPSPCFQLVSLDQQMVCKATGRTNWATSAWQSVPADARAPLPRSPGRSPRLPVVSAHHVSIRSPSSRGSAALPITPPRHYLPSRPSLPATRNVGDPCEPCPLARDL